MIVFKHALHTTMHSLVGSSKLLGVNHPTLDVSDDEKTPCTESRGGGQQIKKIPHGDELECHRNK